jgi:hypothetical protein
MASAVDKQWGDDYSVIREMEKKLHALGVITLWVVIIATVVSWLFG